MITKPFFAAILAGLLLVILCLLVPIPLYDGVFYYRNGLVQFESEGKVALSYFYDLSSSKFTMYGIQPESFEIKKIGWVIAILIHIGLPTLIGLRIFFAQAKNKLDQPIESNSTKLGDE